MALMVRQAHHEGLAPSLWQPEAAAVDRGRIIGHDA